LTRSFGTQSVCGALALALLALLAFAPAASAVTYTVGLQTSASSYSGTQAIPITGTVSPAPGANTGVIITIENSNGSLADVDEVNPSASTGAFNYTSHPGGNAAWIAGTYTVNATWGGDGTSASAVVTFTYLPGTTTTTSTITTSIGTTNPAPEFPSSALAIVALVAVAMAAVLSRRFSPLPERSLGR
jgi:hypothetical protein